MTSQQVSILAVNVDDIASYNQAKYLLDKFQWIDLGSIEEKQHISLMMLECGCLVVVFCLKMISINGGNNKLARSS